jgi:hypothetical protein
MKMKNTKLIIAAILSLIFASCEQDNGLENKEVSGKDVPVRIRSMNVAEGGSESLTRSSSQKEPEMVTTPIGDGMLMEMSIKEDDTPLRDKTELTTGAYFRIIAVKAGTTEYHSHGDYIYGNPSTLLTDFHVKIDESYDYICFSYNKTTNTLPVQYYSDGVALPSPSLSINPANDDPLWCKITGLGMVTSAGVDLDILLKRRLAKVKVKVDCGYNGWKITGVTANQVAVVVNNPANNCTLNWGTGILSGTSLEQGLTYSISDATRTDQTSNEVTIIPNGNNAVIKIGASAVSRNGYATAVPTAEKSATLAQALSGGVSYTITMRLRTPIFARSNIYWDATAQKLTFEPAADNPAQNDDAKAGYQGVFFRFGSLVGISPVGNFSGTTDIYVPIVNENLSTSTWKATTGNAMAANNTDFPTVSSNWTTWKSVHNDAPDTDIPYMDPRYAKVAETAHGRGNTYVIDDALNRDTTYQGFRGDICQYLTTKTHAVSGDYRLPTSYEFGLSDSSYDWSSGGTSPDGWQKGTGSFSTNKSAGYADGTADLLDATPGANGGGIIYGSCINRTMDDVIFPASGCINDSNGELALVGFFANYWSASVCAVDISYYLNFDSDKVYTYNAVYRGYAFPIRCVKK